VLNRRTFFALLGLSLCCSCRSPTAPVDPVWGKQPCAHCLMLVSDPRYAAQAIGPSGDAVYFDDVGCLASYLATRPDAKGSFVRTSSGRWLEAAKARFRSGAATPMDFGFVVDEAGSLDFSAVVTAANARNRGGM
jgi:copper chaperone NosL